MQVGTCLTGLHSSHIVLPRVLAVLAAGSQKEWHMVCDPWNSLLQNLPSGCFESEALEGFVFCESVDCMLVGWPAQHPVSKKA